MPIKSNYKITIPADDRGYTHRYCPDCQTKFGIRSVERDFPDNICCPYCNQTGSLSDFNVQEQFEYASEEGMRQIEYDVMRQIQDSMKSALRSSRNVKFKPATIHRKPSPTLIHAVIPTDMICSSCEGLYEIYGIASRCPFCGNDDIKIMEANLSLIEKELDSSRALRQVYNDLVIAFQNLCRFYSSDGSTVNFQNIRLSEQYFKDNFDVKLLNGIKEQDLTAMKTAFEKRHKEQHTGGIIDQKYVDALGLDNNLVGQKVSYSKEELTSALNALVIVGNNLRQGIPKP